jgi:isocitrate/isopropylmalate dehydrogenase
LISNIKKIVNNALSLLKSTKRKIIKFVSKKLLAKMHRKLWQEWHRQEDKNNKKIRY